MFNHAFFLSRFNGATLMFATIYLSSLPLIKELYNHIKLCQWINLSDLYVIERNCSTPLIASLHHDTGYLLITILTNLNWIKIDYKWVKISSLHCNLHKIFFYLNWWDLHHFFFDPHNLANYADNHSMYFICMYV